MPERGGLPIRLEGVRVERGRRTLVHDLTLRLEAGPLSVLLGPNGAGKSVLLRLLAGLLQPSAGTLEPARRPGEGSAIVLQRPVLLRRSVLANVEYALRLRGIDGPERDQRVRRVLEATGLLGFEQRPARRLSVGEQQRLAIARAWALEPDLVLLDEPAAPLDPPSTRALEEAVRRLHEEGRKVVLATHDLGQARRLADEILFIHEGRVLEQAGSGEFFEGPKSAEARAFLAGQLPE
ncbi:MAG: ATP-binding cassette domain-containing protein [Myxococcota bacterium]|nr:ATP-binding cassette domain-containing protein [Myxococcota bacterium]